VCGAPGGTPHGTVGCGRHRGVPEPGRVTSCSVVAAQTPRQRCNAHHSPTRAAAPDRRANSARSLRAGPRQRSLARSVEQARARDGGVGRLGAARQGQCIAASCADLVSARCAGRQQGARCDRQGGESSGQGGAAVSGGSGATQSLGRTGCVQPIRNGTKTPTATAAESAACRHDLAATTRQ
jgi:hypothetical protein